MESCIYANRSDAIEFEIIRRIKGIGADSEYYDIEYIANEVLGVSENGFIFKASEDNFWLAVLKSTK